MAFWQQKVLERVGSERLRAGVCRLSQQRKAASSMAPRSPLEQIDGSRPAGGCCPFPGTTAEERRQAQEAPDNANAPSQRATRDWPPGGRPHRSGRRPAKRKRAGCPCFACRRPAKAMQGLPSLASIVYKRPTPSGGQITNTQAVEDGHSIDCPHSDLVTGFPSPEKI